MRKVIAGISLAVLAVVGLGACSNTSTPDPAPAVSHSASAPSSDDQAFLDTVHENAPGTENVPDSSLENLGHAICGAFDQGATVQDVANTAEQNGVDAHTAGVITGAAVGVYCPEHMGDLSQG